MMTSLQMHATIIVVIYVTTASLLRHTVDSISLAPVNWNMSNPIFKTSKNDHVIEVKLYDDIDFVCPHYPLTTTTTTHNDTHHHLEYYVIYLVSRAEYRDCNIYDDSSAVTVLNCSNPRYRKRFTILFEPFQSIPNVPEYHAGRTYYFITTSTGGRHGLSNLYQGACNQRNMKLTIRVCCETQSTTTSKSVKSLSPNTIAEDDKNSVDRASERDLRVTDSQLVLPPGESHYNKYHQTTPATSSVVHVTKSRHQHRQRSTVLPILRNTDKPPRLNHRDDDQLSNSIDQLSSVEDISNVKHAGLINNSVSSASRLASLVTFQLLSVVSVFSLTVHIVR